MGVLRPVVGVAKGVSRVLAVCVGGGDVVTCGVERGTWIGRLVVVGVDGEAYYLRAGLNKKRYQLDAAKEDGQKAISLGVDPRRVALLLGALPDELK